MSSPSGSHFHPSIHGKSRISCSQRTDSSSNSKHQSKVQFVQKDTNQSHQFAKLPANPPSQRASASDFPSCQVHKSIQSDPFSPLYPPLFFLFHPFFFFGFCFQTPSSITGSTFGLLISSPARICPDCPSCGSWPKWCKVVVCVSRPPPPSFFWKCVAFFGIWECVSDSILVLFLKSAFTNLDKFCFWFKNLIIWARILKFDWHQCEVCTAVKM